MAKPKPSDEGIGSAGYLPPSHRPGSAGVPLVSIVSDPLELSRMPLGTLASQSFNLVKQFSDPSKASYRVLVYTSSPISSNPTSPASHITPFGQLWRAVCKDPISRKTDLVNLFSEFVSKVTAEPEKKAALRQWLEESWRKASSRPRRSRGL
ncbi:hypothetical protein DFH09DRAFT_1412792 [Mycena vulgaris]|nr:hypothetical protein DFH09DRAFT_1412792 [Mycena vulgaris]